MAMREHPVCDGYCNISLMKIKRQCAHCLRINGGYDE